MKQKVLSKTHRPSQPNHLKLIELEKKLTLFMLNTEESFVLVGKDFKIVTYNRQFNQLYKRFFGKNVVKGESILSYAQNHTLEGLKKTYHRVFKGQTVESELDIPLKNGSYISFLLKYKPAYDENKSIIGAFVSSQEITEIKKARLALVQSEDQYRSLVEHSMMAVFLTIPDKKGTILQANKAAVNMFGYSLEEFETLNRDMLFVKNDPNLAILLERRKRVGKAKGELTGIRKNRERFPCEYSSASFLDMNGNTRTTTTVVDISEQKKTQQDLKTKEEHLRIIIDNEPECVSVADRQGKLLEINPAGVTMFQARSARSVIGRNCIDFIHPADKKTFNELHQAVYKGEKRSASFRIHGLKNRQLWVEANAVPLKNELGKVYAVLSVIRDITARIEADEKIKESEATLRAIFDNSTEGLMLLDAKGNIKAFNAMAAENHALHNVRGDLEVGRKLIDYIDKNRKAYFKSLIAKVLKGESVAYDIDYARKDGGRNWFHAALSPVWEDDKIKGICIARSDISERKIAEQQIGEAMERYNMVAKATNDSIYDWNLLNDQVIRSGDGLKSLFGYDPLTNSGADFWKSRVHPEDYEASYQKLHEVLQNPELFFCKCEYRFRKADGNYAHVIDKGLIIRNENGEAIRMIGATQDLSDMKMTEQHLKDLLNITRDQNKRLQNFAHIVSHNIRSHSSNIIGLMELLDEHEDAKILNDNNLFSMLKTSTLKLSETIENLNDIITVQNETNKQKSSLDINSEIAKTCDAINIVISKTNTRIVNKIQAKTFVNVIPSYLESILLNLLTNAIKYKSPDRDPVIELQSHRIEDYLVITIKDNGIGIDMDKHRDKLFGMYKTFHNNKDARGFGLFITKNQIEAMNGKIEIESKLGIGTTFKLYIYEKN